MVIPWRSGGEERAEALAWVRERWLSHPCVAWVHVASDPEPEQPWSKGSLVARGLRAFRSLGAEVEIVAVADADVWSAGVEEAVQLCAAGEPWVAPHSWVARLSPAATALVLAGREPAEAEKAGGLERMRYEQTAAGGLVVLRRELAEAAPIDPRFEGWGYEDEAWRYALESLGGPRKRLKETLFHLWHPPQKRSSARLARSLALKLRYGQARRHGPEAMRKLVAEAVRELARRGIGEAQAMEEAR